MRRSLGDRPIESLVDLPMMDDPEIRAAMKLFGALGELAYHADGDLFQMISCWMVKLTCRHGTSEYSTIGYGAIAVVLGPAFHRFADGEAFARLAVAVAERYGFRLNVITRTPRGLPTGASHLSKRPDAKRQTLPDRSCAT